MTIKKMYKDHRYKSLKRLRKICPPELNIYEILEYLDPRTLSDQEFLDYKHLEDVSTCSDCYEVYSKCCCYN